MINDLIAVSGYTFAVLAFGFTVGYALGYLVGKLDNKK